MTELTINEQVHVPAKRVGLGYNYRSAMVECRFLKKRGNKGVVDRVPYKDGSEFEVDIRLISKKLGFLILQLGDYCTEEQLLEPLLQATTIVTELILEPQYVWKYRVRSLKEFETIWLDKASAVSHLVLVGHGDSNGLIFGKKTVIARDFARALECNGVAGQAFSVISLCCKSGNGNFGKEVSGSRACRSFIGPSGAVHVSNASLFYQSLVSHNLLEGLTSEKAYQLGRVFTPGVTEFNMWRKKKLVDKPSRKEVLGH